MRIFGGKFRSTVHAPNQPDTVNSEDWRSLQLDIQVCTPILPPVLVGTYDLCDLIRLASARRACK